MVEGQSIQECRVLSEQAATAYLRSLQEYRNGGREEFEVVSATLKSFRRR